MAESLLLIKKIRKLFVTNPAGMVNLHFAMTKIKMNIRNLRPEAGQCSG